MDTRPGPDPPTAVAIRSRRRLVGDALAHRLTTDAGFQVVGHVATAPDLLALCRLRRPDLVLYDAGGSTLAGLAELRERFPRIRVVLLHERLTAAELALAGDAGVAALVPYSAGVQALLTVLRAEGRRQRATEPAPAPTGEPLTDPEVEILGLIAGGATVPRIADLLAVAPAAVESAKRRVYVKLGVVSQNQAVARAVALGLIHRPGPARDDPVPDLTPREADILRSIAQGHTVRQTARLLGIATKTVENTQARLFLKLGTHNRAGAIAAAHRLGVLVHPEPHPS